MRIWPSRWWWRAAVIAGVAVVVLAVAAGIDVAALSSRVDHVAVHFPSAREGTTWVLVGSDSRAALPAGPAFYGTSAQAPGSHADAVIVVHQEHGRTTVLSIPRDTIVSPQRGEVSRLALTLGTDPQLLVDGLCRSLQIPATRLVVMDMRAFAAAVDALGGITISNPTPVRDLDSGLDLRSVGRVHLGGVQSLALLRSRHPETLAAGRWVAAAPTAGDLHRTRSVGTLFGALMSKARGDHTNPIALQRTAWALTGGLTTDHGTSLFDLLRLRIGSAPVVDVPVTYLGSQGIGANPNSETARVLAAAGYAQPCRP